MKIEGAAIYLIAALWYLQIHIFLETPIPLRYLHWSDALSRRRRHVKGSLLQKFRRSSCFYTNFKLTPRRKERRHWFSNWLERPKWMDNIFMGSPMHWVSLPVWWAPPHLAKISTPDKRWLDMGERPEWGWCYGSCIHWKFIERAWHFRRIELKNI